MASSVGSGVTKTDVIEKIARRANTTCAARDIRCKLITPRFVIVNKKPPEGSTGLSGNPLFSSKTRGIQSFGFASSRLTKEVDTRPIVAGDYFVMPGRARMHCRITCQHHDKRSGFQIPHPSVLSYEAETARRPSALTATPLTRLK